MNEEQKKFIEVIKKRKRRENRLKYPSRIRRKLEVQAEDEIENKIKINQVDNKVDNEKQMGWYWWLPLILAILFAIYLLLRI